MITYYPELYPGEIFYSGNARFSERSPYPAVSDINSVLFGKRSVVATVEFPSHLDVFLNNLPCYYELSFNELVQQHTLFPYYGTFIRTAIKTQLLEGMRGNGSSLHMRSGLMASKIHEIQRLRYCPKCVEADWNLHRETFWHTLHQIQGVLICPIHKIFIEESDVIIRHGPFRFKYLSANPRIDIDRSARPMTDHQPDPVLLLIARDAAWLLENYKEKFCLEFIMDQYHVIFQGKDQTGRKRTRLLQEFCDYYDEKTLHVLGCEIDREIADNWLVKLIRGKLITHNPVRHLLFIHFLGYSLEELLHIQPETRLPFGKGPWHCLNPVCKSFRKNVITRVDLSRSAYVTDATFGTFTCTECGYAYRMKVIDSQDAAVSCVERVIDYGSVWREELSSLWTRKDVSLRNLAKRLGVDPKTIERQAAILCLQFPRHGSRNRAKKQNSFKSVRSRSSEAKERRKSYRHAWQQGRKKSTSTIALRRELPKEYIWLYRNDREWLDQHKPKKQKVQLIRERVDWKNRDKLISGLVAESAKSLLSEPGKPLRLTISSLGRKARHLGIIQQHLDKLPLTKEALIKSTESREAFAIRKVIWVRKEFYSQGISPLKWQVIKKAGVERLRGSPLIQKLLEDI